MTEQVTAERIAEIREWASRGVGNITMVRDLLLALDAAQAERAEARIERVVKQAEAIDAKVRLKYIGEIKEQTERAEVAEAELARLRAQGTWQPITSYQGNEDDVNGPLVVWNGHPWLAFDCPGGWYADVDGELLRVDPPPTLWLPAPPETEGA